MEIQKTLGTSDSPVHFSFSMQLAGMRNQPQYYFFPREGRRRKGFGGHCDKDKEQLGQLCACLRYYCIAVKMNGVRFIFWRGREG